MNTEATFNSKLFSFFVETSEIQRSVLLKLHEQGIDFLRRDKTFIEKKDIIGYFKNYFLQVHPNTASTFLGLCAPTAQEIFINTHKEYEHLKSVDYHMILYMFAGFIYGAIEQNNRISKTDEELIKIVSVLPNLFSAEEIVQIKNELQGLILNFNERVKECHRWIIEDEGPREKQMQAFLNLADLLSTDDTEGEKFEKAAHEVQENFRNVSGGHNIVWNERREGLGFLTPPKRLIADTEKILLYLNVLHHAGYEY